MKVKFLSGPKQGTTEHINNQAGAVLIAAGMAVEVPMAARGSANWLHDMKEREEAARPTPVIAPTVTWNMTRGSLNQRYAITARCARANCSSLRFDGVPDLTKALEHLTFTHSCGGGAPEMAPQAICDQYRKVFNLPTAGADEAAYYRSASGADSRHHDHTYDEYTQKVGEDGRLLANRVG